MSPSPCIVPNCVKGNLVREGSCFSIFQALHNDEGILQKFSNCSHFPSSPFLFLATFLKISDSCECCYGLQKFVNDFSTIVCSYVSVFIFILSKQILTQKSLDYTGLTDNDSSNVAEIVRQVCRKFLQISADVL